MQVRQNGGLLKYWIHIVFRFNVFFAFLSFIHDVDEDSLLTLG